MIPNRFEDIGFSDLEALLNNQVAEGKTIEYKKEIVTSASSDKEPFLAGISAFANTVGGDFIISIEAKDGIPSNLSGVNFTSADAEILRLEQMLQTGLEPRLPSINIKDISSSTGENFILIRVNRSWIAPHRVRANDKFYGRNSKGKYPLDVSELKTAFMLSEQLTEKIRNFRAERVRKIKENDELPTELIEGGKIILHLVPLSAFSTESEIDVVNALEIRSQLQPIGSGGWNHRVNLDGFLTYSSSRRVSNGNESYAQLFRNGIIETVASIDTFFDEKVIPSQYYEQETIRCVNDYLKIFSRYELEMPVYVFLSFVNVKDYALMVVNHRVSGGVNLERGDMILPETVITTYDMNIIEILRPIFDRIWNAFGYQRSFNFDESGKWIKI